LDGVITIVITSTKERLMHSTDNSSQDDALNEPKGPPTYTTPSDPPQCERRQRRSWWADVLDECRNASDQWRRTHMTFSRSTASQLASDIRNGPNRDVRKARVRGLLPGERWETRWGKVSDDDGVERYAIWLKYIGQR
jgi:hypothetical protein